MIKRLGAGGPQSIWSRGAQLATTLLVWGLGVGAMAGSTGDRLLISSVAALATMTILERRGRPRRSLPTRSDDVSMVGFATLLGGVAAALLALTLRIDLRPLLIGLVCFVVFLSLLIVRSIVRQLFNRSTGQRVVVIGVGQDAHEVTGLILDHPEVNLEFVGVIGDFGTAERHGLGDLWLGDIDELSRLLIDHQVDAGLVTTTGFRSPQFRQILGILRQSGVEPMLSTGVAHLDSATLRVGSVVHEPLVSIDWQRPSPMFHRVKRVLDVIGATIALLFALPVMALVAIAIKLDDRGPVFYRSPRVGLGSNEFGMLKFRSMRVNADEERNDLANRNERSGPLFKVTNDPRITRIGRVLRETSLDEVPQLINVLKGEMSLVGPRPALLDEAAAFDDELQARFSLQPGITGLWQVEARSNANFTAYRRLDLHYVANQSLRLDLEILIATGVQVIVSVLLVPVGLLRRGEGTSADAVDLTQSASVVDIRDRFDNAEAPDSVREARP